MTTCWRAATALITVTILTGPTPAWADGSTLDHGVIVEWNGILQRTIPAVSILSPRYYAMMHIAMFDAANSVEPAYKPFRIRIRNVQGASAEAAAAQAAHDVLQALIPTGASVFSGALEARLATIPPSRAALGAAVGHQVAAEILAWRAADGWNAAEPGFERPPFPGQWQVTPGSTAPTFTRMPGVQPMALLTVTQYLPPPPPS